MFKHIKLFAAASFVVVLCLAGLVGMYVRTQVSDDVKALAERNNQLVAQYFTFRIWEPNRADLSASSMPAGLDQQILQFVRAERLLAMRVYTPKGLLLYTTGGSLSAREFAANVEAATRSPTRIASSTATGSFGGGDTAMLLRSLVPIRPAGAAMPEGYVEVYSDITPQMKRLMTLQYGAIGGVVAIFLVLVWVLVITTRQAEAIIAKQHEANAELAAAAASAQEENREKSQFLANISHELRTPLNAIIGFSEIIKNELMGEVQNQRYQDYISDIHTSGVHLLSLINDILDFSKAEAGKLELEISEVNATKTISNCLRLVSPRAEAASVELLNAMPKDNFVLESDGKKFKQVMLNLLSNAVKFTPAGGRVRVSAWRDLAEDAYVFEVTDSGIGIAPKDIAKAMAPFGQVDNALSRRYEGTGLGLPLTRKFCELLGGKFNIQSELNVGTTITITLPRAFKEREDVVVKRVG